MDRSDCKHEREIIDRVHADTGLLLHGLSVAARLRNAYEFTREVARALAADGWGLRLQTIGLAIDQCSVDSIVHFTSGDVALVVRDAGGAAMMPCFEPRPAKAEHQWIDPNDPESKIRALSLQEFNLVEMSLSLRRMEDKLDRADRAWRRAELTARAAAPKPETALTLGGTRHVDR